MLFRLPEYSAPYRLTVTSLPKGFGTWKLFIPTIVLLDPVFQLNREVSEAEFTFKPQTIPSRSDWTARSRLTSRRGTIATC